MHERLQWARIRIHCGRVRVNTWALTVNANVHSSYFSQTQVRRHRNGAVACARRLVATSTVTVPSPPGPNPVQQPSRFAAASHDEVSVVVGLARVGVGVPLLDGRTRYSLGAQQGCKYANCEIRTYSYVFQFPPQIKVLRIPWG